eukprot:8484589-Heterocapsa_arctica.AAC.1
MCWLLSAYGDCGRRLFFRGLGQPRIVFHPAIFVHPSFRFPTGGPDRLFFLRWGNSGEDSFPEAYFPLELLLAVSLPGPPD